MTIDTSDSFMDMLALRLSSVPFHELSGNRNDAQIPINRSTTKPVTISFIGPLSDPVTNPKWYAYQTIVPLPNQSEGVVLPVVRLVTTVVQGNIPTDSRPTEWLISGDLCMIGEQLAIIAQSLYIIKNNSNPQQRLTQVCATGLLASIVQKHNPIWSGMPSQSKVEESLEDLDWDEARICESSVITIGDVTWLDVGVGLARREESDPHHWLELRHALVSMKCRRPIEETNSGEKNRVLQNLEPITIVGQLLSLNLETQEFFIQL